MLVKTKFFGEVDLPEEKIITFERGLIGLADYKKFTILYDCEKENSNISWLQSVEEPTLALPVVKPWIIKEDYNPVVEDELLSHIGELTEENLVILVTMTVPEQIEQMSVNLKAPIIVNADTRKGAQIICENNDYEVKYKIYDILKYISQVFLPALTVFVGVVLKCFNVEYTDIVITIMTAFDAFLGSVLMISSNNYNKTKEE